MKLIEKYIIKQLLTSSLLLIILIISIFALSKSVQLIELSLNRGLPFIFFLKLILLSLPSIIPIILPIILCLSILFTYSRMKNDSELIIFESSGTSKISLLKPVIIFGTLLSLFSIYFTLHLAPLSNQNFKTLLYTIKNDYSSSLLEEGTFNTIGKDFTIFIKKRTNTGQLNNVFIHDSRNTKKPTTLIAKRGSLIKSLTGTKILLEDGTQHFYSSINKKLSVLYFEQYLLNISDETQSRLGGKWKSPSERTLYELKNPDLSNGDDQNNLQAFKAEITQRFSLPLNVLAFSFLIVSFILSQKFFRTENKFFTIKVLLLIIFLKAIFIASSNIAIKNIDFELVNFFPSLLSIVLGVHSLYKNTRVI